MIPAALLPHRLTVLAAADTSDGYGDPVPDWDTATPTPARGYLQPAGASEETDARDAQIGDWVLYANTLPLTGSDRVAWDGHLFEVLGPPEVWSKPGGRGHLVARLREVVG